MGSVIPFLSRMRQAWNDGLLYNGRRDLYKVFGWKDSLCFQDLYGKYKRQNIARRIVDAPADGLWSDPPKLTGDAAFNQAWQDLLAQIPLFHKLQQADKLAGLGRYSVLVFGFDRGALKSPVRGRLQTVGPTGGTVRTKVMYLQPYSEESVSIAEYDENPFSPTFGRPLMYELNPGHFDQDRISGIGSVLRSGKKLLVHASRVLHVAEGCLESQVFGHPRLEAVYNDLDDLQKISGGSAETFWLTANRGMHFDVHKDMEVDPESLEDLAKEIDEYEHGLRRVIRSRGVTAKALGSDTPDPRGAFDVCLSLISGTTSIPKRVLMGSEAGQLASQQDRANWATFLAERTANFAAPIMFLPTLRILIDAGVLPPPQSLIVDWPDAFKMNPLERAQTSAQMARSATNLAKTLQTVEDINQSMATAALPRMVPAATPSAPPSSPKQPGVQEAGTTSTTCFGWRPEQIMVADTLTEQELERLQQHEQQELFPNAFPPPKGAPTPVQKLTKAPPLMPKRPPIELLTPEECRQIIGFGKHPPVFDETKETQPVK